jgi:hypothetical protein
LEGLWVHNLFTHSPTSHGGEEDVFAQVGGVFKSKRRGDFAYLSLHVHWQVIEKTKRVKAIAASSPLSVYGVAPEDNGISGRRERGPHVR